MDDFVPPQNITLFRQRLEGAPDGAARQIRLKLLAEEGAKRARPWRRSKS